MRVDGDQLDLTADTRRRRFEALYAEHKAGVIGYVLRRTDSADDAADVIAETFLVAWRRLDDAPAGATARLWLYGVARRVLANHRRGERRRIALADRLREDLAARPALEASSGELVELAAVMGSLADGDREVLTLEAWEGLGPQEIAAVLGCSRNAARIRLHRARRRLGAAIAASLGCGPDGAPAANLPVLVAEAPEEESPGICEYRPGHEDT
jgi:RNA polymerase sigma factor (sigma-70 family)